MYTTDYRLYDPQIGRFHQIDALGELSHELSMYAFASNNPVLRNDPSGLKDTVVNGEHGSTSAPLQEVVVVAQKKSTSVGQPGTLESIIPVWGSGRAAVDDFQNGRWGWGIFNTALAISDVFLVKSIVTGVGKLVAKAIAASTAEQIIKINTERITLATLRSLTRESLINSVNNPSLKKVIENLYRPGAKIGSGSTADLLRLAPDAGHLEKGGNYITGLRNLINSGNLSGQDLDIASELMHDLIDAVSTLK